MRSNSVNIFSPLLCAVDVSLLRSSICRPLPSGGITRFHRYYGSIRFPAPLLPSLPLSGCRGILLFPEETAGSHELPVSPYVAHATVDTIWIESLFVPIPAK